MNIIELGLGYYHNTEQKISGQYFQDALTTPDVLINYKLQQMRLMLEGRWMYTILPRLSLNGGLGLGIARLSTTKANTTVVPRQAGDPVALVGLSEQTKINPAIDLNLSASYELTKHWFVNGGTSVVYVGKSKTALVEGRTQTLPGVETELESNDIISNRFWIAAEYRF